MSASCPCMDWWWRSATPRSDMRSTIVAWRPRTACRSSGGRGSQVSREARRVCGSDLLDEVCAFGRPHKFRHYFYGATPKVVEQLIDRLQKRHPGLSVAGYRSPPFRPLTPAEDAADIAAINEAEPDFVWVGLGMPKQENWMVEHLGKINATALIGVGAAFDFHAGTKPRAPVWMQHAGLEWLFRLLTEPRRLAHRYLIDNSLFIGHTLQQVTGLRNYSLDL